MADLTFIDERGYSIRAKNQYCSFFHCGRKDNECLVKTNRGALIRYCNFCILFVPYLNIYPNKLTKFNSCPTFLLSSWANSKLPTTGAAGKRAKEIMKLSNIFLIGWMLTVLLATTPRLMRPVAARQNAPRTFVTKHTGSFNGQRVNYLATVGETILKNPSC
jgi:hypothetical protein